MSECFFTTSLAEFANITMGQSPGSDRYNKEERGLPFLQGCAEFGPRYPAPEIYCHPPLRIAKQGSILISVRAPVGTMNMADQNYCIGRGLGSIQGISGVSDTSFLHYAIEQNAGFLHRRSQGSTFLAIGSEDLKHLPLPKLNIKIQERISKILAIVDAAIEKTDSLISKYQRIKMGLMHDLFTRGVTIDGKLRPPREQAPELYKETPIGWIPKEWQYDLLDELALRGSGHTPNKNIPQYWNGTIKWVSLADSHRLDRLYITETEYEVSQAGIQNSSAVIHPAGTVILSRDAGIGKSAITTEPMAVSQHFMCWRCNNRLDRYFLYYWLQFKKRTFENIAMGSTILTIGLPYFKKLKIVAPRNREEQKRIGEILRNIDIQIFALEADLKKKNQQKQGLMHDLLTGKVSVKAEQELMEEACA